jgi:hypothetical protein
VAIPSYPLSGSVVLGDDFFTLIGKLVDETGDPVRSARVTVYREDLLKSC